MAKKELSFAIRVVGRATEKLEKINRKLEKLSRPINRLNDNFRTAQKSVRKYTASLDKLSDKFKSVGTAATLGLTLPLTALGASTIQTAADFQHSMTKVKTLTQGDLFHKLKQQARDFGSTTKHSATQAANAMVFYSMAGFRAREIYKSMPATLDLATAATEELSATADILSGVIRSYQIPMSKIGKTTDMLTAGFANAKMDLVMLGEALAKSGGTFNKLGVPLSELIALIGKLRDVNIDPSSIGTALATASSRLVNPVKAVKERISSLLNIDASELTTPDGKLGSFVGLLEKLETAGAKASDFYAIFGVEPGKYLMQFLNASKGIRKLQHTIENSTGITRRFAREFEKGATGSIYSFKSAIEALKISIAESGLLDFFAKVTFGLAETIQKLSKSNPALLKLTTIMAVIAGIIGPILLSIGAGIGLIATSIVALKFASIAAAAFGTSLIGILGIVVLKIGLVVGAIAAIAYIGWFVVKNWKVISTFFVDLFHGWANLVRGYFDLVLGFLKFYFVGYLKTLLWFANFLEAMWDNPTKAVKDAFNDISNTVSKFIGDTIGKFMSMFDAIMPSIKRIMNFLIDPSGKYIEFSIAEDLPDYPTPENEEVTRTIKYGQGPLLTDNIPAQEIDFNYKQPFEAEIEEQTIDLIPDFIEDLGSTISDAFESPVLLDDFIEIDIDEKILGKNIDLKPKIDFPKSSFESASLKPFGPGDFFKGRIQSFADLSKDGSKIWNTEYVNGVYVGDDTPALESLKEASNHKLDSGKVHKLFGPDSSERSQKGDKEVKVIIDFENVPKGVAARTQSRSIPLKVNMGFAMDGAR